MALVIPPTHYQCLIPVKHSAVTRSAAFTFGVREEDVVGDPEAVADEVLLRVSAAFLTHFDSETVVGPVQLTFDQGAEGRGSISGSSVFNGSRTGVSVAANTALLIRKNTNRVGRPGRGRMFLPWVLPNTTTTDSGGLLPATRTTMQTAADTLLSGLQANGLQMVILHDDTIPGTTTPSLVTSLTVDPVAGTQRRRMRF